MGIYYNKIKALVDNGRLSVYAVIAPPRSNSTVMEHILSISPDIQHACHEPFAAHKKGFQIDDGYKQIYDSIGGQAFEDSEAKTTVVVKEMAHWLGVNKEYENFLALTDHPVVLLIRNPLLAVESRIRRTMKALDMRPSLRLVKLLDVLMHDKDFQSEAEQLLSSEEKVRSILSKEVLSDLSIEEIYSIPNIQVQNEMLDHYAKKKGYFNWHDLAENKLYYEHDYKFFQWFLQVNKNRLKFEENEFKNLDEIAQYLKQNKRPSVILDTTDMRADPENQLRELCLKLGISFSQEMIKWGERPITIVTTQTLPHEHIWYEELYGSREIKPPTEIPPTLDIFPDFMQRYIIEADIPIYARLSREKQLANEDRTEKNKRTVRIKVSDTNFEYLYGLGVITDDQKGQTVDVNLRFVDPIYAMTNEPLLFREKTFRTRKQRYSSEISIMNKVLKRVNYETVRELHPRQSLK